MSETKVRGYFSHSRFRPPGDPSPGDSVASTAAFGIERYQRVPNLYNHCVIIIIIIGLLSLVPINA